MEQPRTAALDAGDRSRSIGAASRREIAPFFWGASAFPENNQIEWPTRLEMIRVTYRANNLGISLHDIESRARINYFGLAGTSRRFQIDNLHVPHRAEVLGVRSMRQVHLLARMHRPAIHGELAHQQHTCDAIDAEDIGPRNDSVLGSASENGGLEPLIKFVTVPRPATRTAHLEYYLERHRKRLGMPAGNVVKIIALLSLK